MQPQLCESGPFYTDNIQDGDRYELSNGHPIYCGPAGSDYASYNLIGATLLDTDPNVEWAGVDAGCSLGEKSLLKVEKVFND